MMFESMDDCVAFTGHRSYDGAGDAELAAMLVRLRAAGRSLFLSGMAMGFDLAAAEAVLRLRARDSGVRLMAVVPFVGQERAFPTADRRRYDRVLEAADEVRLLAPGYYKGCYAVRNNFLVDHAAEVVAWYDGRPGGTRYTVERALRLGRRLHNLCPSEPTFPAPEPTLF